MSQDMSTTSPITQPSQSIPKFTSVNPSQNSGVAKYYNSISTTEHSRLITNRVEFEISLRTILAHLPKSKEGQGLKIADIGGGTGRYAVQLAKLGHQITLLDISHSELDLAAQHAQDSGVVLDGIYHADASALFETCPALLSQIGTFDAVLLLGPLYHLLQEEERVAALRDAGKLLKPLQVVLRMERRERRRVVSYSQHSSRRLAI
ncbi:hypothetical protein ONS95_004631 [Cadophora gregata]|uniref:uncharacterized protein n=1 Tax=Cadophora gregata TaxID=51156 RepID=UPI0026DBD706|nr:uncharacterized protein ONS95_004631 [Cadophora gregata]KAK0106129.1 hypothetical protein ONS95_004631 [Cadophora gregata]